MFLRQVQDVCGVSHEEAVMILCLSGTDAEYIPLLLAILRVLDAERKRTAKKENLFMDTDFVGP